MNICLWTPVGLWSSDCVAFMIYRARVKTGRGQGVDMKNTTAAVTWQSHNIVENSCLFFPALQIWHFQMRPLWRVWKAPLLTVWNSEQKANSEKVRGEIHHVQTLSRLIIKEKYKIINADFLLCFCSMNMCRKIIPSCYILHWKSKNMIISEFQFVWCIWRWTEFCQLNKTSTLMGII